MRFAFPPYGLRIEICDLQRVRNDEVAAGFHNVAHESGKNLVGVFGVGDFYL